MLANTSNLVSPSSFARVSALRGRPKRNGIHQTQLSDDNKLTFLSDTLDVDRPSAYEQLGSANHGDSETDLKLIKPEYRENAVKKSPKNCSRKRQCVDETQLKHPVGHMDDFARNSPSGDKFSISNHPLDENTTRSSEIITRSPETTHAGRMPIKLETRESSSTESSLRFVWQK
jgi:hypothetical protein